MSRTLLSLAAFALLVPAAFSAETPAPATGAAPKTEAPAKATALGTAKVGDLSVTVEADQVAAGKDAVITLTLPAGTAAPKSVQVWVSGHEDSKPGDAKDKVTATAGKDGVFTATVKLPTKLGKHAVLEISIEPATGKAAVGSVPLHKA